MEELIKSIHTTHKTFWTKDTILSLVKGVGLFILALVIQHYAYNYIDNRAEVTAVGDILLNNLPTVNLDFFIVQGALIFTFVLIILFVLYPRYIFFAIKALSLFLIIRSFFITLTHLGVNLHQTTLNTHALGFGLYDFLYNAKNDFFFSGHVGSLFLFGLIFWAKPVWRYIFFIGSFIFGVSMILAHMHYSIDVFAAPFITYSIFIIAKNLFKKDFELLRA